MVYQYIVSLWTLVKGYNVSLLSKITVYDLFNRINGVVEIRTRLLDPTSSRPYDFSEWELELIVFYFINIRSEWVAKAACQSEVQVRLWFEKCDEVTELLMVNSRGASGTKINFSRVNISRQKNIPKHLRVCCDDRRALPFADVHNHIVLPLHDDDNNDDKENDDHISTVHHDRSFPVEIDEVFPLAISGNCPLASKHHIR